MYDFTIIIPTHNRHHYLKRSIEYFSRFKVKVVYCDSTETPYSDSIFANISYLHLPNFTFSRKILYAIENIDCGVIALCADDDFLIIDSLIQGFAEMQKNEDIAAVFGNNIEFFDEFDGSFYADYKFSSRLISGSIEEKIKALFSDYRQVLWGMYRTPVLVDSFEIINHSNFTNDNFFEMVLGCVIINHGNILFIENIWSARELSSASHWANRHKDLRHYYIDRPIQKDYKCFVQVLDEYMPQGIGALAFKMYLYQDKSLMFKILIKGIIKKAVPNYFLERRLRLSRIKEMPKKRVISEEICLVHIKAVLDKQDV